MEITEAISSLRALTERYYGRTEGFKTMQVRVPQDVYSILHTIAEQEGVPVATIGRRVLADGLERMNQEQVQ